MTEATLDVLSETPTIKTADGLADAILHRPAKGGPFPAVIMYQDALGVRPDLDTMAKRVAGAGYTVLLPNLFYRHGPARAMDFATEQALIFSLAGSLTPTRLQGDIKAFLEFLDKAPGTSSARVGCHGYCMGGGCALVSAALFPNKVVAAASIHGARLATDAPESPHKLFPQIKARVYLAVAGTDQFLEPGETDRTKAALDAAKVRNEVETYEGVQHGFAVPGTSVYDKPASERHWKRLLDLYRETLK